MMRTVNAPAQRGMGGRSNCQCKGPGQPEVFECDSHAGSAAPGSAVTTAGTPRPVSAPRTMPQGRCSERRTTASSSGPGGAPARRDSHLKRLSVSTYTPWNTAQRVSKTRARAKEETHHTHPVVRLQVVYLFGEDLVPELFADELHGVQVLIEARLVARVAVTKEQGQSLPPHTASADGRRLAQHSTA